MICEMAAAVAAAVSELPRPPDEGAAATTVGAVPDELELDELDVEADDDDDDDDDEEVDETLAGMRKPLTDSGFRLELLLAAAIILLLLLLLLLLALTDELEDEEASGAAGCWRFPCGATAATLALASSSAAALPSTAPPLPFADGVSWFMMISWHSGHRSCTYSHFRRQTPWK